MFLKFVGILFAGVKNWSLVKVQGLPNIFQLAIFVKLIKFVEFIEFFKFSKFVNSMVLLLSQNLMVQINSQTC